MTLRAVVKNAVARLTTSPPARSLFRLLVSDRVVIFMLHRFDNQEDRADGHDPEHLRKVLSLLDRENVPMLSLREVADALQQDRSIEGVAFTVDDGYLDFYTTGAPVFEEFGCPVTVFLTTGFIDGNFWFWWDKIEYALANSPRRQVSLAEPISVTLSLDSSSARRQARQQTVEAIKTLPEQKRAREVEKILSSLETSIPERPPHDYAPMTWNQARQLAKAGVGVAPHSVTHPSLATADSTSIKYEIQESLRRVEAEIQDPVRVFCYPYGMETDVSVDVAETIRECGLRAAVTAMPGYARTNRRDTARFTLPRFSLPDRLVDVRQIAFGVERFKELVRSAAVS